MDSYHKVVVPQKRSQENEIFVNSKSPATNLLSRVVSLFKVCRPFHPCIDVYTIDHSYSNKKSVCLVHP